MYLKPSDLGPIYKAPIFAEVYILVPNNPNDYLTIKTVSSDDGGNTGVSGLEETFLNIYLH